MVFSKTIFEAHYKDTIKPFKDMPMSGDSLIKISPTLKLSNKFLNKLITGVDCENPKDILF